MNYDLFCRLWLSIAFGPANRRINQLLDTYHSPQSIYQSFSSGDRLGLSSVELRALENVTQAQIHHLIDSCKQNGIAIYTPDDEEYPNKLYDIDNPPNLLFSYGDFGSVRLNPSVALIGARDADDYALISAYKIAYELARRGITVISGFARGIDSAAHNATLSANGQTVAVLGSGIMYDYPRDSMPLKKRIGQNGAVLSEYYPPASPARENFKVRNRIVSGLADVLVVIQAGQSSGTLNTVNHALSQGRDIFVLPPHDIFADSYKGNIGLLRDGAIPLYSANDIINHLAGL